MRISNQLISITKKLVESENGEYREIKQQYLRRWKDVREASNMRISEK